MDAWMIAALSFVVVAGATFGAAYLLLRRWPVVSRERLEGRASGFPDSTILRFEPELASRWQRIAARIGEALGPGDRARRSKFREKLAELGLKYV